jgi:tape measure domain-containing protein
MAMTDMQRLVVSLEARTKAFENALKKANSTSQRQLRQIEKQFADTNKKLVLNPQGMGRNGGFMGLGRGVSMAAIGVGLNEVRKYADAWTEAGNKIAAASEISGRQGRTLTDLNKIAAATRSGITETVDLYSKLLLATKGVAKSEREVALATEIVNKAFKAGGQSAQTQAAGILQLGQALSSGVLQGDELRSLRENAPVLLQQVAKEFNTTIGGLKQLGAEGKLTSDRVFKAILSAQGDIDRAFSKTKATIGDSFTILNNTLIEAVGRLDAVTGASGKVGDRLGEVAAIISGLSAGLEYVAGTSGAKFIGFLSEALSKLEPISAALELLSNQRLQEGIGKAVIGDQGDATEQIKRATRELERFFQAADVGVKSGFLSEEQGAAIRKLRDDIAASRVTADQAAEAIRRIGEMKPGTEGMLVDRFDVLIGRLRDVVKSADEADAAIAGISEGGRAGGFTFLKERAAASDFLKQRNADAARTPLDADIDKRAKDIVEAAQKVGVAITDAAAKIQAANEINIETAAKNAAGAVDLIKEFEGFRAKPYFDVNAYRVGYGSDTITLDDGTIQKVTQGITVTLTQATRDLERRVAEFQEGIRGKIGGATFDSMTEKQQAALTSIAYNYGSLPERIVEAIKTGNVETVYNAIKGLGGDNGGINRDRRNAEAQLFIGDAPKGIRQGIDSREDFARRLEEQRAYIDGLIAETGIRSTLNPLVNDYGLALSTVEAAQQLLTEAQKEGTAAGLELSDVQQLLHGDLSGLSPAAREQAMAMRELAIQTGEAEAAGNRLDESQARLKDRLSESASLGKDVLGGFIRDLREGKSATEALANALEKVADKLLDMALNALFDGPVGGSGGGILGGLFQGLFSIFGFADGGIAKNGKPLKKFARGGVSREAAIFGEGPTAEAAVPLPDGRRIPVDLRTPNLQSAKPTNETVTVVLQDDSGRMAEIADRRIQTSAGTIVRVAVDQSTKAVKKQMPGLMANAQSRNI